MSLRWIPVTENKSRSAIVYQANSNVQSEDEDLTWRISRESDGQYGRSRYSLARTHPYLKARDSNIRFETQEYAKIWCEAEDRRIVEDGLKDGSILEI